MLNQHSTVRASIDKYNRSLPLVDYLERLVEGKKEVKIADIGSGPFSIIGRNLEGVKIEVYASDKQDFTDFYNKHEVSPIFEIDYQDMERLTYPDNFFDIVHSANALDHTRGALAAVKEMLRVCRPGGWIYIDCNLDQLDTGGKHYWNAKADGVFDSRTDKFDLKDFGFKIKFIDEGGPSRYNRIIATLKKAVDG